MLDCYVVAIQILRCYESDYIKKHSTKMFRLRSLIDIYLIYNTFTFIFFTKLHKFLLQNVQFYKNKFILKVLHLPTRKFNTMRKRFAILLGLIALLSVQLVYGDPVETRGKWGDKYYRSINPLPPSLSIQGNILSVDFMNALENLTITITDEQGTVIMEDNISGETGECITIILNNESTGRFYVKLEHQLGWLMGEFIIQNN